MSCLTSTAAPTRGGPRTSCTRCGELNAPKSVVSIAQGDGKGIGDSMWEAMHSAWFKIPQTPDLPKGSCRVCGHLQDDADIPNSASTAPSTSTFFSKMPKTATGALHVTDLKGTQRYYEKAVDVPAPSSRGVVGKMIGSPLTMRVVTISDTHDCHWQVDVPDGDVLIHTGDIFLCSRRFSQNYCKRKLRKFNAWLGTLPHQHKIVVSGNHDIGMQNLGAQVCQAILTNATYAQFDELSIPHPQDSSSTLEIFACPFSRGHSENKAFQPGAFPTEELVGCSRMQEFLRFGSHSSNRPFDIAITHAPLMPRFPLPSDTKKMRNGPHWANVHIGGHLHDHYGAYRHDDALCVVACSMDGKYRIRNAPIVVDVPLIAAVS